MISGIKGLLVICFNTPTSTFGNKERGKFSSAIIRDESLYTSYLSKMLLYSKKVKVPKPGTSALLEEK